MIQQGAGSLQPEPLILGEEGDGGEGGGAQRPEDIRQAGGAVDWFR